MKILRTVRETVVDGPGIRYAIYVSGCSHSCKKCHNPESWDFSQGRELTQEYIDQMKEEIISNPLLDGITISGGDPLHPSNTKGLLHLLQELRDLVDDIWVYTGYTVEDLLNSPEGHQRDCLEYIDTLVDGPYVDELKDLSGFKGSSNQRYVKLEHKK